LRLYFFIGVFIIFVGFGVILWLLWREGKQRRLQKVIKSEEPQKEEVNPSALLQRAGLSEVSGIQGLRLDRMGKSFSSTSQDSPSFQIESDMALKLDDLRIQHEDLKKKYHKLDQLLQDRMAAHDKAEKNLASELKNRKEFNKIKDLFEKELRDKKDDCRKFQIEVKNAQNEAQSYFKRIDQLEESLKKAAGALKEQEERTVREMENSKLEKERVVKLEDVLQQKEAVIKEKDRKIEILMHHFKDAAARMGTAECPSGENQSTQTGGINPLMMDIKSGEVSTISTQDVSVKNNIGEVE
jgi:hypothetical protein